MESLYGHRFYVEDAKKYGVNEAIFLFNIRHWVKENFEHNRNYHDGKHWTYKSIANYALEHELFSKDQIRRYTENLVKKGALLVGNYNKRKYDKTKWYALTDEDEYLALRFGKERYEKLKYLNLANWQKCQMDLANSPNGFGKIAKPIPDIKNKDIKNKDDDEGPHHQKIFKRVLDEYNALASKTDRKPVKAFSPYEQEEVIKCTQAFEMDESAWSSYFHDVSCLGFLNGLEKDVNGRYFKASLSFLVTMQNMEKIKNGLYEPRKARQKIEDDLEAGSLLEPIDFFK
jgi:hypothetical protein